MKTKEPDKPTTSTPASASTEAEYEGPFGTGRILKLTSGRRDVDIKFSDGRSLLVESTRVDLEGCGATTLAEALHNALHSHNRLALFTKTTISGAKALIIVHRRSGDPTGGYATIIKKGTSALRFALDRIDLDAMKAPTINKALRTVAWETGAVRLKPA